MRHRITIVCLACAYARSVHIFTPARSSIMKKKKDEREKRETKRTKRLKLIAIWRRLTHCLVVVLLLLLFFIERKETWTEAEQQAWVGMVEKKEGEENFCVFMFQCLCSANNATRSFVPCLKCWRRKKEKNNRGREEFCLGMKREKRRRRKYIYICCLKKKK